MKRILAYIFIFGPFIVAAFVALVVILKDNPRIGLLLVGYSISFLIGLRLLYNS